ncbi:MAG: hypothetical protein JW763_09660, partial [candidate division Zixibacteria bacterium]|nr:hypothetical protein [candidate division Zixibacteria bacterium]
PASHADPLVYCAKRPHSSKFNPLWDDCEKTKKISHREHKGHKEEKKPRYVCYFSFMTFVPGACP